MKLHLEPVTLIGRLYATGSYEERSPFDGVFTVLLLGGGKAKILAAHGRIDLRAYGEIARQLRETYGVTLVDMDRHGRPVTVDTERASQFGDL